RGERIAGRVEVHLLAMHEHATGVRAVNAREDLAERALPRAVLPAQRVTGALGNVQRHSVERLDADEALADLLEANGAHCGASLCSRLRSEFGIHSHLSFLTAALRASARNFASMAISWTSI